MEKIVVHRPGGFEQLCLEQHADLSPGPGEVLIDVKAIGINYADCVTRMGLYASARQYVGYPITPGFEVAGEVASLGRGVTDLALGAEVIALTRFGGYASQIAVNRTQVFAKPDRWSMAESAGFATVFLTAWFALFELAHVAAKRWAAQPAALALGLLPYAPFQSVQLDHAQPKCARLQSQLSFPQVGQDAGGNDAATALG